MLHLLDFRLKIKVSELFFFRYWDKFLKPFLMSFQLKGVNMTWHITWWLFVVADSSKNKSEYFFCLLKFIDSFPTVCWLCFKYCITNRILLLCFWMFLICLFVCLLQCLSRSRKWVTGSRSPSAKVSSSSHSSTTSHSSPSSSTR